MKNLLKTLVVCGGLLFCSSAVQAQVTSIVNSTTCGFNVRLHAVDPDCVFLCDKIFKVGPMSTKPVPASCDPNHPYEYITIQGVSGAAGDPNLGCDFLDTYTSPGCNGASITVTYSGSTVTITP